MKKVPLQSASLKANPIGLYYRRGVVFGIKEMPVEKKNKVS